MRTGDLLALRFFLLLADRCSSDRALKYLNFVLNVSRAVNPPFLAGRLPVLKAVSLSPYFKRNLPVFENNRFSNIKIIASL